MVEPTKVSCVSRDPRYDILFEPVQIGPVTARNRFYQVPHCSGMGHARPNSAAAMRGVKAEGGWAVVSTEECDIHHTSDISPYTELRLWDDSDIPMHAKMVEAVHEHGALAAIELSHGGREASNFLTRADSLAPSAGPAPGYDPIHARAMTKKDIRDVLEIYRVSALRAQRAGFDIVYVYCAHALALPTQFLARRFNHRTDEYGGSLQNRVRFLKEVIETTKNAVGEHCAVALRFSIEELMGEDGLQYDGEGIEVIEMLAELPDLWDVNVSDWDNDSATSRFEPEGYQEKFIRAVKSVTTKPVVGVGRFTSPDEMVSQIKRGVLDMIGAARPSIADPFLPKKIEEGRVNEIRECIGCNICVTGDYTVTPSRCTQNPTFGEEWRRGWHPERFDSADSGDKFLIVGAGPAGLECAVSLGKRGCAVTLVDAHRELGGRVVRESRLPGLSAWIRVRDYRQEQLSRLSNVEVYPASKMAVDDILEVGADRVIMATGSSWRRDGSGRNHNTSIPIDSSVSVWTPDDFSSVSELTGNVLIYDDDHFYMGGVLAELICAGGAKTTIATPAPLVSHWTQFTLEQWRIQSRLLKQGVSIHTNVSLDSIGDNRAGLSCVFSDQIEEVSVDHVVLVTARNPDDQLYWQLKSLSGQCEDAGIRFIERIGDCLVPGTIAAAVYSGHKWARELGESQLEPNTPFRREMVSMVQD